MEKKIVVPKGMLEAVEDASNADVGYFDSGDARPILEAALRWLSENPIVPTNGQTKDLWKATNGALKDEWPILIATKFQRSMFLALEPSVPEAIKDLLATEVIGPSEHPSIKGLAITVRAYNDAVFEAYNRGLRAVK